MFKMNLLTVGRLGCFCTKDVLARSRKLGNIRVQGSSLKCEQVNKKRLGKFNTYRSVENLVAMPKYTGRNLSFRAKSVASDSTDVDNSELTVGATYDFSIPGVYIEDTDCYQVVYYANYFNFFDRAIQEAIGHQKLADLANEGIHMSLLSIEQGKYAMAAVMGDPVTVNATLVGWSSSPGQLTWSLSSAHSESNQAFVAATLQVVFLDNQGQQVELPSSLGLGEGKAGQDDASEISLCKTPAAKDDTLVVTPITVFTDEVGPGGILSTNSVLRYFERNRTDIIGGGAGLKRIQEEGVMFVVARFSNGYFSPDRAGLQGSSLVSRSDIEVLRRNTTIVFHQSLWQEDRLIAQADITLVCIKKDNMRICPCPDDVLAQITS